MIVDKKINLAELVSPDEMDTYAETEGVNDWLNALLNDGTPGMILEIESQSEYVGKTVCIFHDCAVFLAESERYETGFDLDVINEDDAGVTCLDCNFYVGDGVMHVYYNPDSDDKRVHLIFKNVVIGDDMGGGEREHELL